MDDEGEGHDELLYASIVARNEIFRYYRFQTPDDDLLDYYDQDGRSSRKFLVRTPILSAIFTSGYAGSIRSLAIRACTPASTGAPRSARRSSPPAMA